MFLRKLVVMAVPLLMVLVLALWFPLWQGETGMHYLLKGVVMGVILGLLLPLSGAIRRREAFSSLLWVPVALLGAAALYQAVAAQGGISLPVLNLLETSDGQVFLMEGTFFGFMLVTLLRTKI